MAPTCRVPRPQFSLAIFCRPAPILSPTSTNPALQSASWQIPWFSSKEAPSRLTTAGDVKVTPTSNAWTEFNVTDVDGTVRIAARKGDVTISDGKGTVTLAQGQETTRDESSDDKKKNRKQAGGPTPGATGGVLNSPIAIGIAGAAVVGLTTWVLVKDDDPASPAKPK